MALSMLRPLALHLHHHVRSQSKTLVQLVQNFHHLDSRALSVSTRLLSEDAASVLKATQPESDRMSGSPNLFHELSTLGSIEDALAEISKRELSGNEASLAVSALRHIQRKQSSATDFVTDERFSNLSTSIVSGVKNLSNESLTSTLTNAFHLHKDNDDLILALEGECRRRLRLLPIRSVAMIVCNDLLLSSRGETKALVYEAARVLELRWRELQNPMLVRRLLPAAARVSSPLLERLEDKTLEMLSQYSFQEITSLTKSLSATNMRSLPILRAVSYQLLEQRSQWEIAQMVEIMSCMGNLGFQNPGLFSEFASHIQQKLDECSVSLLCDIAKTYAVLRIQATDLLDSIHRAVAGSLANLSTLDLKRLLFAYSQFYYQPPNASSFYDQIGSMLAEKMDEFSRKDQVDLVHSLTVLQKVPPQLLGKIFQSTAEEGSLPATQMLKLVQIDSYAKLELVGYQGPFLAPELKSFPDHKHFKTTLHKSLVKVLQASLGEDFSIVEDVRSDLGYVIDAEISSNREGNGQKMAIVTFGPPCYLSSTRQLVGRLEMMLRHLRLSGYQVMEISYHDWYPLRTPMQQVNYLKEKLKENLS